MDLKRIEETIASVKAYLQEEKEYKQIIEHKIQPISKGETKEKMLERLRKLREENQERLRKSRDAKIKEYERKLSESLSMQYFPERIEAGVRRPAEWLPDFNIEVIEEIHKIFTNEVANKIYYRVRNACEPRKREMLEQHKQKEAYKLLQEDDIKQKDQHEQLGIKNIKDRDCTVCFENAKNIALVPCGHVCICEVCSKHISDCPLCRAKITYKCKIYL